MRQVSWHCTVHIARPSSYSSPLRLRTARLLRQVALQVQLLSAKFLFKQLLIHIANGCIFGVLNVNPDRPEITQIPAINPNIRFICSPELGLPIFPVSVVSKAIIRRPFQLRFERRHPDSAMPTELSYSRLPPPTPSLEPHCWWRRP